MMYVEDILRGLGHLVTGGIITDRWTSSFISNVIIHVGNSKPLSTNQSAMVLKIAAKYVIPLTQVMKFSAVEIRNGINNPNHLRTPFESSDVKREVRYIGINKIAFRFKMDAVAQRDIRNLGINNGVVQSKPEFHLKYKIWIVQVDNTNLARIHDVITRHKFEFDDNLAEYLTRCENSQSVPSAFVADEEDGVIYANICNNPVLAYAVQHIMKGKCI